MDVHQAPVHIQCLLSGSSVIKPFIQDHVPAFLQFIQLVFVRSQKPKDHRDFSKSDPPKDKNQLNIFSIQPCYLTQSCG